MGTVPTPADPAAGSALTSGYTHSWYQTHAFLLKPPSCRVTLSTDVSGWSAAATAPIVWDSESWDIVQSGDTEMHSATTNPERITIRTAGRYHVHGVATIYMSAAGSIQLRLFKNGTGIAPFTYVAVAAATGYALAFSDELYLAVGDYLTLQVNPSAAGLTVQGTNDVRMVVTWVSN